MTAPSSNNNYSPFFLMLFLLLHIFTESVFADNDLEIPFDPDFAAVTNSATRIDFNRLNDREYEKQLILKACPMFADDKEMDMDKLVSHDIVFLAQDRVELPLPHSIKISALSPATEVEALISGGSPHTRSSHQAVCLNHLIYAIAHGIQFYKFFTVNDFAIINDFYPHSMKLPALMSMLKKITKGKWVLWVDDDVITSEFTSTSWHRQKIYEDYMPEFKLAPRPIIDRAIEVAQVSRGKENRKRLDDATENFPAELLPAPEIIVTTDIARAKLNTGMIWVRNTPKAKQFLQVWWNKVKADQYPEPESPKFYCLKTHQDYDELQDCLTACSIKYPKQYGLCGFNDDDDEKQHVWRYSRKFSLYDQDALRQLFTENEGRLPLIDRLVLIPQRGDFLLKTSNNEEPVIEGINAFFRTGQCIKDSVEASNPLIDKWVHVSGVPWGGQRESLLITWLAGIKTYPLKRSIIENLVCGNMDFSPYYLYQDNSRCQQQQQQQPPQIHDEQPCSDSLSILPVIVQTSIVNYLSVFAFYYAYHYRRAIWRFMHDH